MTIKEFNEKYPNKLWVVSYFYSLMTSDHWELFLTKEEAEAFYNSIERANDKKLFEANDIWGFTERAIKGGYSSTLEGR